MKTKPAMNQAKRALIFVTLFFCLPQDEAAALGSPFPQQPVVLPGRELSMLASN